MASPSRGLLRGVEARDSRLQGLRGERKEIDTGSGTIRVPDNRVEHISRGTFVNYYDDLGFSATPQHAEAIREEEEQHKLGIKQYEDVIATNRANRDSVSTALGTNREAYNNIKIPSVRDFQSKTWNTMVRDPEAYEFTTVRIVDKNNKILYSYVMPKETAKANFKRNSEAQVWAGFVDGGERFYNVSSPNGERLDQLNTKASNLQNSVRTQVYNAVADAKETKNAINSVVKQRDSLATIIAGQELQYGEYDTAVTKDTLFKEAAEKERKDMWDLAISTYKKIFSNHTITSKFEQEKIANATATESNASPGGSSEPNAS